jgi:hypothetical protein
VWWDKRLNHSEDCVENSKRYLQHRLYFDFPVCPLLWLKRNRGKDFSIHIINAFNNCYKWYLRSS